MPDVYSNIAALEAAMQERLADVLETRGADPQQQEMRRTLLAAIPFAAAARVLEVGCGTGVLTRMLARWPGVGEVVGVDPAPSLLSRARALAAEIPNIRFEEADGRSLPFDSESFDVVVFDSTLSHVPEPERALAEAHRVLRPLGWLATFDGDYSTTTVALSDHDPLQACADMTMANSVHDRWLMRRLASLVRDCGFQVMDFRSHGFVETHGGYMLTVIDRGADMLCSSGRVSAATAAALKAEARRRAETGAFFAHIAYVSLTARRPA
jgi:ubiquinone/menaquinone biosynthesis C-methylase UbiE